MLRSFSFLLPPHLADALPHDDGAATVLQDLSAEERVSAVTALTPYLLSYRSRMAAAGEGPVRAGARGGGRAGEEPVADPNAEIAVLVDTALLQALLLLPDSGALLRFVQRPNCVDLPSAEACLRQVGRYAELVALYQVGGCALLLGSCLVPTVLP